MESTVFHMLYIICHPKTENFLMTHVSKLDRLL